MAWEEIKYALNSKLGEPGFKSLDEMMGFLRDKNRDLYAPVFMPDPLAVVATSPVQTGFSWAIAVDDGYVYYSDYTAKTVVKMNKSNLAVVATSPVQTGHSRAIVVDDGYVYYSDYTANTVVKMNKSNLAVVAASPVQASSAGSIAVDDGYVYFADTTAKTIIKMTALNLQRLIGYERLGD